ncbi:VOC family protein [Nocardia otitidiscaviarum]|uniref:VOC family protein n=1 Tax=Nocardia otitidiscaviarum TaxID=1823 RepID=UPI001893105B|nr:VOC family protein [Nocardia otitidiscaviarum]MBF6237486.1 VOC family protein [Nocardia otitidiscaviarum]
MTTLRTFVWFDNAAEEAANFYTAVVPDSRVLDITRNADGTAFVVDLELAGHAVTLLNGGPGHPLNDSISLQLEVDTQEEIDRLWEALTEGGEPGPCGWLSDRFGLTWQVTPAILPTLLNGVDPAKTLAAGTAMRTMGKLDIKVLQDAYDRG